MAFYKDSRRATGKPKPCPMYVVDDKTGERFYCDGGAANHEGTHYGAKPEHQYEHEMKNGYKKGGSQ